MSLTDYSISSPRKLLQIGLARIEKTNAWIKGAHQRTRQLKGGKVEQYCLIGSFRNLARRPYIEQIAMQAFVEVNRIQRGGVNARCDLMDWNDQLGRTKAHVVEGFKRTIEFLSKNPRG